VCLQRAAGTLARFEDRGSPGRSDSNRRAVEDEDQFAPSDEPVPNPMAGYGSKITMLGLVDQAILNGGTFRG